MKIEELTLIQQSEVHKKYPDLNFEDHFYEFLNDGSMVATPYVFDRYGDGIKLGDRCLLIQSAGNNNLSILDCKFVGFKMLKKDNRPLQHPMAIFRPENYGSSTKNIQHKKTFYNLINMEKRFD